MKISAALVKQLREKTGAGMGACKKALVECEGDLDKAEDLLRAKGVKASQQQRDAGEGAVLLKSTEDGKAVAVVELRCETDFAARNDNFKALLGTCADAILESKPADLDAARGLEPIAKGLQEAAAITIRENIVLATGTYKALEGEGKIGTYTHHNGKVGVAIAVNAPAGSVGKDAFEELLRDLAMHATAHHPVPLAVNKEDLPADMIERERQVALSQIDEDEKLKGKPANIKEKMVEGKLRKFYEERALLEQKFVKDPSNSVKKLLEKAGKDLGGEVSVAWFVRQEVGAK